MSDSHQHYSRDFLPYQGSFSDLPTDTTSLPPEWADDPHAMALSTNYGFVGATSYADQMDYLVNNPMSVNLARPYGSGQASSLVSPSREEIHGMHRAFMPETSTDVPVAHLQPVYPAEPPYLSFRAHASPERPRAADNLSEVIYAKCFFNGPCYVLSPDEVLTPADVRRHLLECHQPASGFAKDDFDKKLRCLWHNEGRPCMTTVKDEAQLMKHVATCHFKVFEIFCPSCRGKFSRKDSLKRHNAEIQCKPHDAAGALHRASRKRR